MATIYKILSPCLQECYVGSTTQDVEERWWKHKGSGNDTTSKVLLEQYGEDCKFVVLEVCPIEERFIKERWWQEHSVGSVNCQRAFVSEEEKLAYQKDYYNTNRENIIAKKKAYYKENREELLAKKKIYTLGQDKDARRIYMKAYHDAKKAKNADNLQHLPSCK